MAAASRSPSETGLSGVEEEVGDGSDDAWVDGELPADDDFSLSLILAVAHKIGMLGRVEPVVCGVGCLAWGRPGARREKGRVGADGIPDGSASLNLALRTATVCVIR